VDFGFGGIGRRVRTLLSRKQLAKMRSKGVRDE
jgi:hypothetical protein